MAIRNDEWWDSDLAVDIHGCLKQKEESMCRLQSTSPLMYLRRYLVDWMALTCQKFKLSTNSQHLAVALYDRYTGVYSISIEELKAMVVSCLLVASKFEEREERIPKFRTLMDYLQWELSASDYLHMELKLLTAFNWNIGFATAAHFKEFYMQAALSSHDLHYGRHCVNKEEAYMFIEKNVNYFMEVSLQDPAFLAFKPSLIAAACFASARMCLHISPTWTAELRQQTDFSWCNLVPCIEILLRIHDEDRKAAHEGNSGIFTPNQQRIALNSADNTPVASPETMGAVDHSMHRPFSQYGPVTSLTNAQGGMVAGVAANFRQSRDHLV